MTSGFRQDFNSGDFRTRESWDRGAPTQVVPNSHQAKEASDIRPVWQCLYCSAFNGGINLSPHCAKCGKLKAEERIMRQQARAVQGLGRGGGYFERDQPADKLEAAGLEKDGFDIYGRRRTTGSASSADPEPSSKEDEQQPLEAALGAAAAAPDVKPADDKSTAPPLS